jgi:hypothetical protein
MPPGDLSRVVAPLVGAQVPGSRKSSMPHGGTTRDENVPCAKESSISRGGLSRVVAPLVGAQAPVHPQGVRLRTVTGGTTRHENVPRTKEG